MFIRIKLDLLLASLTILSLTAANDTFISKRLDAPVVQIHIPDGFHSNAETFDDVIQKEDPSDVEEFPVPEFPEGGKQGIYPNNNYPNNNYPNNYYPNAGYDPTLGVNPLYPTGGIVPTGGLEAFTARKAIDLELLPGRRIRFLDTVTRIGRGWNNGTSEFICYSPGIFFFTFSACGERFRHFRITLKHNEIGVVSAYGDANGYQMATNSAVLRLFAGDRVYLQLDEGGVYEVNTLTGRAYNTFTGFRIL